MIRSSILATAIFSSSMAMGQLPPLAPHMASLRFHNADALNKFTAAYPGAQFSCGNPLTEKGPIDCMIVVETVTGGSDPVGGVIAGSPANLAVTCSDWKIKPDGHWITLRPTNVEGWMDHSVIDDLAPNVITTGNASGFNVGSHPTSLFDVVNGACLK